jgi:hypothetical protein
VFSRLSFRYDPTGKRRETPLVLAAADVRAECFTLVTTEYRTLCGIAPAIHVCRRWKDRDTGPYNEDGRPPIVWTTLVYPHVEFLGGVVEVVGLEAPNLGFAGLALPAYEGCPRLKLPAARRWDRQAWPRKLEDLPRQRLLLS